MKLRFPPTFAAGHSFAWMATSAAMVLIEAKPIVTYNMFLALVGLGYAALLGVYFHFR